MMKHKLKNSRGFTLIELMIVVAIMGILGIVVVRSQARNQIYAESEVRMQYAVRALRNQVEVLKTTDIEKLKNHKELPFDSKGKGLSDLVAGRGVIVIKQDSKIPGLWILRVEVHWRDPRVGMRSIHTVLFKT